MLRIIDTYPKLNTLFENQTFCPKKWEAYMNSVYDNSADIFKKDMNICFDGKDNSYENDVLPILNAVHKNPALELLHNSFCKVTDGLNERIVDSFGKELDMDIVLYVGLCNGAGWVTNINGRDVVLLGIEKILELNWYDEDSMYGLIYHELGHVYHKQYGTFWQDSEDNKQKFVWQLFTEGIAMYFEQVLVKNFNYYHQDRKGWKEWCDTHFHQIVMDFTADLPKMTRENQTYFGDWVKYHGLGDVGYYLGTRFVQHLLKQHSFEQLIHMKIEDVYKEYITFAAHCGKRKENNK